MLKKPVILCSLFLLIACMVYCNKQPEILPGQHVKELILNKADSIELAVTKLLGAVKSGDDQAIKKTFLNAREAYKKAEWFCEYYAPSVARELNGPPLPEIETEETKSFEPSGLQVIEEYVYPFDPANTENLLREIRSFRSSLKQFKNIAKDAELTEPHIFDACKLEVFRIITTGITGFDTPLSGSGISEASASLASVSEVLSFFADGQAVQAEIAAARGYLAKHQEFNNFNRMTFIRRHANRITASLVNWQKASGIPFLSLDMAIRSSAKTMFEPGAINVNHFVNSAEAMPTVEKIRLGKALFSEKIISASSRTCATCHKPEMAFTDGSVKSAAFDKGKLVKRNAPSLYYAGLQNAQFYDMRAQTLENQAMDVIANKDEMHASIEEAAKRLEKDAEYVARFKKAFPTMETELRPRYVMISLASYIRSLNPFNSRFDQYMRGDDTKMTSQEVKGFNLFMGKAKCGTCHFAPVFNGTAAPVFASSEAEVLGVPADPKVKRPLVDADEGRFFYVKIPQLKYAFKTPTLRNSALTAPYMHNGAYGTLEEVIEFYNKGGGAGIGIQLENQTLSANPLNLSRDEQRAVKAFLITLTDKGI